jgi:protein O-GlcNAc transferase
MFERIRSRTTATMADTDAKADASAEEALRLLSEGNACEDAGRMEEAMQRYEAAVRVAPTLARGHLNRGNVLLATGDTQGALDAFAMALKQDPAYAPAHFNMGNAYVGSGRPQEALAAYRKALAAKPEFADAEVALGVVLEGLGQTEAAAASYRRALELNPRYAEVHANLGNALRALGQSADAAASYRRALELDPNLAQAHSALGDTLQGLGQLDDAADSYRRALLISPDYGEAHHNLGNALQGLGQSELAVESYHRALEIKPDVAVAHFNLGNAFRSLGRLDAAVASYRRALEINANLPEAHCKLGNILKELGQLSGAQASYRRALELRPDFAEAHCNLGSVLKDLGQLDDAVASFRRSLEINPDSAEVHFNLGNGLRALGQLEAGAASYRDALSIDPDYASAHRNLGNTLEELGRLDGALASYRRALAIAPDSGELYTNLLFGLSHKEGISAQTLFAEHRRFGEKVEAQLHDCRLLHGNTRKPTRSLQIGFVSGDFRLHPIASFIEPVLTYLAGYPSLSMHAYYNYSTEDIVTKRLRGYFRQWNSVERLSDKSLAQKINDDGIDILIDLSGHTAEHRLLAFARKPAPIQASWIGYPGTTGLAAMDYYLTDRYFLPPGMFDNQFTEKLVHLPASGTFLPDKSAPPVNALPALSNGYVTFGNFNRLNKLTPSAIALWSRLLRALPNARMLIAGMPQEGEYDSLIGWFAREGIVRERLSFHSRCPMPDYHALHHQVDICLDTFPYTGGTTTQHALWMGVPTLTLAGQTPPGRQGAAILGRLGLDEFIANDAEDFVQKGVAWAGDLSALTTMRVSMRDRIEQSPIRRPAVIAAGLESAFRIMWQRWCAGLPAETFEVNRQQMPPTNPQASS